LKAKSGPKVHEQKYVSNILAKIGLIYVGTNRQTKINEKSST
jgi:hypothetical protein